MLRFMATLTFVGMTGFCGKNNVYSKSTLVLQDMGVLLLFMHKYSMAIL